MSECQETAKTQWRLGLAGYPIDHSLSPRIHQAAYEQLNVSWSYDLYPCATAQDFEDLLDAMKRGEPTAPNLGLNVTTPYKAQAAVLMDELDESAVASGAVNVITVCQREGKRVLRGAESDGIAVTRLLQQKGLTLSESRILLCGTGSLAAVSLVSLLQQGASVFVAGRSNASFQSLMQRLNVPSQLLASSSFLSYEEASQNLASFDGVINATSAGLRTADPLPLDLALLHKKQVILEATYRGKESSLTQAAQNLSCPLIDGLDLLVEQALPALDMWQSQLNSHESLDLQSLESLRKLMVAEIK